MMKHNSLQAACFPMAAIVGQELVKQALLINLVNPKAGPLLIGGRPGTGKTLLARSCAAFSPLVNLPLNITQDMLLGSIDIEAALQQGKRLQQAGLLQRAHGSVLYIDEVNLLPQEILLPTMEAQPCLVATMNPAEGTLPRHILDRFGMYVETQPLQESRERVTLMKRVLLWEAQPAQLQAELAPAMEELLAKVNTARHLLPVIVPSEAMVILAAQLALQARCPGHRAELFLLEAAKALAALEQRRYILPQDLYQAAQMVLPHRSQNQEQQQNNSAESSQQDKSDSSASDSTDSQTNEENSQQNTGDDATGEDSSNSDTVNDSNASNEQRDSDNNAAEQNESQNSPGSSCQRPESSSADNNNEQDDNAAPDSQQQEQTQQASQEQIASIVRSFPLPHLLLEANHSRRQLRGSGKRSKTKTNLRQGRYVRAQLPRGKTTDLAFDATIRAAAPWQHLRPKNGLAMNIQSQDLREKLREKRIGSAMLFVVDASGSMGARARMQAVKGAIFQLLQEAYQKRDQVGMVAFRRQQAQLLLPITRSVDLAQKQLAQLPTGGKTPLAQGLEKALEVLLHSQRIQQDLDPILILVTDGRANSGPKAVEAALQSAEQIRTAGITALVIDTEADFIKLGVAKKVAQAMGATYYPLQKLKQEHIIHLLRQRR